MKINWGSYRVLAIGAGMGLAAAAVQAYLKVQPEANGISFIGHPADMLAWLTNKMGTNWPVEEVFVVFPVLTVVGVLIGSLLAANRHKELRLQPGPVRTKRNALIFGFLAANLGLLLGSCPIRTALLTAYGSALAAIGLVSIAAGVLLAVIYSRVKSRKGAVVQ